MYSYSEQNFTILKLSHNHSFTKVIFLNQNYYKDVIKYYEKQTVLQQFPLGM